MSRGLGRSDGELTAAQGGILDRAGGSVRIFVDGRTVLVEEGTTLAAAMLNEGIDANRRSVRGQPRGPLCGMGICHECRVTVDGVPHRRGCMVVVREGLEVATSLHESR